MFLKLLFFFVVTSQCVAAAAHHPLARAESIVTSEAAPSSIVNSTVNAIEGTFGFSDLDLEVPGKESMNVIHYYSSKSRYNSWLGTGMSLNYGFWMVGKQFADKERDKHGKYSHLNAEAVGGSVICCLAKDKWKGNTYYLDPEIIYSGLTNCGSGEVSARTNLKNTYIVEKISKDGSYADLTSYFSDGTIKEYHRSYDIESAVNAETEHKPNLSRLNYTYHDDYSPKRITAKSYQTLNWLDFNKKHDEATISSSNGKSVTYKSFEKNGASYVSEIESSDSPKREFRYAKAGGHLCIDRISWPEGRFLEVEYDGKGRVISQKAPIGPDGERRTLYSFSYHPDDHYTKVLDALDRKTIYRYEHSRLTALEQYKKNDKLYRATAFYWGKRKGLSWGEHPKTEEGHLLAEALVDGDKKAHQVRCFTYDDHGNVVKESLYGDLTGSGKKHFSLSSDGTPSSADVDHYSKRYTYTKDRFHAKLSESETDGPTIKYWYEKNSNIPLGKYICDGDKILIREFYSYDKDWVMVQKIVDNGTNLSESDLSGVTQRRITRIKPVRNKEGFGQSLPKAVTELYYDLHDKKEVLLSRRWYVYNKQGHVSKERVFDATNTYRYTIHTQYDEKGRVHRRRNALGQWFVYKYDKNSNKTFERQIGSGFHTFYTYNKANRLVSSTEHHRDKTIIGAKYAYDLMGNKKSVTDRYGNTTQFEYDSFNRLKKHILPELDNGHRYTISKKWDIFDNIQSETDQNGATTTYEYTARRQPALITFADGTREKFEYNLNGTLKAKWDRSDTKTSYSYDLLGRITEIGVYDPFGTKIAQTINRYNAFHLLSTTDPMGCTTYYDYDQAGRKIGEWTKSGDTYSKKTYEYDSLGRVSCAKAYYGKEIKDFIATHTEYDLLDRLTVEKEVDISGKCINWSCFTYDARGNCIKKRWGISDTQEAEVHTPHNSQNEQIKHIDEHNNHTHYYIDHGFKNIFNKQVPRKVSTDPLGNSTEEYFDSLGRIVSILKKNSQGVLLAATDFSYNGTGQKTKQVEHVIIDGQIDRDYTITWEYDKLDRVIKCTEQPDTPDEKITQYQYDRSGRLLNLIKPDGVILGHSYDALGRLLRLDSSDGTVSYSYTYDLHDNPLEVHDEINNFITKRTYDAWDRLLSDGIQNYFTQSFTYDALGRLTSITAPDASTVSYIYDKARLRSIKRGSYQHAYDQFDLRDNVLQSTLIGSAGTLSFDWDKKDRNAKITSKYFRQEIPSDGFDAAGNLKKFLTFDPVGEIHSVSSYDDLYQLIEESGVQSHSYTNDSLSNRMRKNDQAYYVDGVNKLVSDSLESYAYDKNGNMIEKRSEEKTVFYSYDALDRLVKVVDGSNTITYTYDYLHRRIARSKNSEGAEYFLYFGCREVGLFDAKSHAIKEYRVLGLGKGAELGASIAIELGSKVFCPIHDHRGNIVCLVDANTGHVEESYRYTAFGECETYDSQQLPTNSSEIGNPWGYSSKRLDLETGFIYFHRRYYAPAVGRWVTPDPLGFVDGPNMYAYVHNNPLTMCDLYGLESSGLGVALFGLAYYAMPPRDSEEDERVLQAQREMMHIMTSGGIKEWWGNKSSMEKIEFFVRGIGETASYMGIQGGVVCVVVGRTGTVTCRTGTVFTRSTSVASQEVAAFEQRAFKQSSSSPAVNKIAQRGLAGQEEINAFGNQKENILRKINKILNGSRQRDSLPQDPMTLLKKGYSDTSHPNAVKEGHRTFENKELNDILRFDKGTEGAPGHAGKDHYHRFNPDSTGKRDMYLDKHRNPCPKGSNESHLYPGD